MARFLLTVSVLLAFASNAGALPILAIDADPSTAGVQASREVSIGANVAVDVVISGVEVSSPLNAFEFDVGFVASILSATSVADGGFLVTPLFVVEADLTPPDVNFAEATLGSSGASGSGILASIRFDAVGVGVSILDLNDVILSAPFGVPISVGGLSDATITVVPEPSTALLVTTALIIMGCGLRAHRSQS